MKHLTRFLLGFGIVLVISLLAAGLVALWEFTFNLDQPPFDFGPDIWLLLKLVFAMTVCYWVGWASERP